MPVTRIWVLAAIMTGLLGSTVRGNAILTLGMFSSGSDSAASPSNSAPVASGTGFTLAQATVPDSAPASASPSSISHNLATSDPAVQASNVTTTYQGTASAASLSPAPSSSQPTFDAFINLGAGPYLNSGTLTTGNALPWYDSRQIIGLFGGQPTLQQQNAFDSAVLQRVEQTFRLSGVPVTLTDDPNASAAHSLSVVSNAVNPTLGTAIGMTNLGGNGFHFIDNSAPAAQSVDQLEWIVAHNVAHELMLAFGVPEDHDQSGTSIDSTTGQLAMFLNPNAKFSTGAVQDLLSKDFQAQNSQSLFSSPQLIDSASVPEPATLALWGLGAMVVVTTRRVRSNRAAD